MIDHLQLNTQTEHINEHLLSIYQCDGTQTLFFFIIIIY